MKGKEGQMLEICTRATAVEVEGSTGNRYTVRYTPDGQTCTCKGFYFRTRCRHLRPADRLRCEWTSAGKPVDVPGSCPECGAATVALVPAGTVGEAVTITVTIGGGAAAMTTTVGVDRSAPGHRAVAA